MDKIAAHATDAIAQRAHQWHRRPSAKGICLNLRRPAFYEGGGVQGTMPGGRLAACAAIRPDVVNQISGQACLI